MRPSYKQLALAAASLTLMGALTGCSTNVAEHSDTYFTQLTNVFTTAISNATMDTSDNASGAASVDPNAIASVGNLAVDENGNYSFEGVGDAEYYYVYVYSDSITKDATAQSEKITEDGSGSYSGALSDFATLTYGDWDVRVVAYPTSGGEKKASPEASVTYTKSGEVDYGDPQIYYMWTVTSGELTIKVDGMDYAETAYPTDILLTLTNEADSSDVVTIDITDIDDSSVTGSTTEVQPDAVYTVSADLTWDAEYVSNPSYELEGAEAETSSTENLIAGNFYYSSSIFYAFDFPHVQENFDPEEGGSVGYWYNNGSETPQGWPGQETTVDEDADTNAYFEATPKEAEDGALYSYDIVITSPSGSITATPKLSPGNASTEHIFGDMNIYDDGTFSMEIEYQYLSTDRMNAAVYYVPGVICEGVYTVNADGTLNLSYDHENAKETDYDIVQEVTGKAAEWAAAHPEESETAAAE